MGSQGGPLGGLCGQNRLLNPFAHVCIGNYVVQAFSIKTTLEDSARATHCDAYILA